MADSSQHCSHRPSHPHLSSALAARPLVSDSTDSAVDQVKAFYLIRRAVWIKRNLGRYDLFVFIVIVFVCFTLLLFCFALCFVDRSRAPAPLGGSFVPSTKGRYDS